MANNVISGNLHILQLQKLNCIKSYTIMSTTNAHASSSKPAGKAREHVKGGGKGKGPGKGRKDQPRMKSNLIKRQQGDEELKDLQARIDAFVRLVHL